MDRYVLGTGNGVYAVFKQGKSPGTTHKLSEAKVFQSELTASNCIETLPKYMRAFNDWHPILMDDLVEPVKQNSMYKDIDINDVAIKLNQQMSSIKTIVGNKKLLENALEEIELIILDIRHYIEFNELNASDGYKAYKIYRTALKKRREIKDQLETIYFFQTAKVSEIIDGSMEKKLPATSKRTYKIRTEQVKPLFATTTLNKDVFNNVCENIRRVI